MKEKIHVHHVRLRVIYGCILLRVVVFLSRVEMITLTTRGSKVSEPDVLL